MNIINMTPHPVIVVGAGKNLIARFESAGSIRLTTKTTVIGMIDDIPITRNTFGKPIDLPEPVPGTLFIVSQIIKSACPERVDLLVPAEFVRDEAGNIIGCQSLST